MLESSIKIDVRKEDVYSFLTHCRGNNSKEVFNKKIISTVIVTKSLTNEKAITFNVMVDPLILLCIGMCHRQYFRLAMVGLSSACGDGHMITNYGQLLRNGGLGPIMENNSFLLMSRNQRKP